MSQTVCNINKRYAHNRRRTNTSAMRIGDPVRDRFPVRRSNLDHPIWSLPQQIAEMPSGDTARLGDGTEWNAVRLYTRDAAITCDSIADFADASDAMENASEAMQNSTEARRLHPMCRTRRIASYIMMRFASLRLESTSKGRPRLKRQRISLSTSRPSQNNDASHLHRDQMQDSTLV